MSSIGKRGRSEKGVDRKKGSVPRVSDQKPLISNWIPVSNGVFVVSFFSNS